MALPLSAGLIMISVLFFNDLIALYSSLVKFFLLRLSIFLPVYVLFYGVEH